MVVEIIIGAAVLAAAVGAVKIGQNAATWYRVVPTSEAHLVTNKKGMIVYTSDKLRIKNAAEGNSYYAVPTHIPFFGCMVRRIDLTIKEVAGEQVAYEKGQARFRIDWSLKFKVVDVMKAAETSSSDEGLRHMLVAPIEAAVNSITTLYDVAVLRSSKIEIQDKIKELLEHDLAAWGLDLVSFQLGDFADTKDSTIISDISKRTEAKINSETRIIVAEKQKDAKIKEAESAEAAGKREIERDTTLAMEKELMLQRVAEQGKVTQTNEAEVVRVRTTVAAEIAQEKAIIEANMKNDIAERKMIESQRNAEAERLKLTELAEAAKIQRIKAAEADAQEVALAAAADAKQVELMATAEANSIFLKGEAEAKAKTLMAEAMKLFSTDAVFAMTASQQIDANKEIGLEAARALAQADVKAFIGGKNSFGFDIANVIESFATASPDGSKALLNRLAKPNDLGVSSLATVNTVLPETVN